MKKSDVGKNKLAKNKMKKQINIINAFKFLIITQNRKNLLSMLCQRNNM